MSLAQEELAATRKDSSTSFKLPLSDIVKPPKPLLLESKHTFSPFYARPRRPAASPLDRGIKSVCG